MKQTIKTRLSLAAAAAGFFFSYLTGVSAYALAVPPTPTDIPIVDQTATLTADQTSSLAQKIAAERAATGNQIGVLIIPSLDGQILEDYSLDVARQWGIGTKERNSGVLLLIAKNDRKIRIEVGYGLEGALTDIRSGQIIRDRMAPAFRQNDYYGGVSSGVDGIIMAIHGETDPAISQTNRSSQPASFPWEFVLLTGFFVISWLGSILARTKSWWAGGVVGGVAGVITGLTFGFLFIGISSIIILTVLGLLLDRAVSRNFAERASRGNTPSWWAGGGFLGGGGSSGSGGFGGFGGGGFGGGGASGGW
jgi:uncharacterized protein